MLRLIAIVLIGFLVEGCHTTTLRVESQPPGAQVHYDFKPVGTTPVEFPVDWYGKHKLTLDHPVHGRRIQVVELKSPGYLIFPMDFVAAVAPAKLKDQRTVLIDFTQPVSPDTEEDHGAKGQTIAE
ncbi:MAG: PEGA domain-containing protein [bacterium]|jgi:hypothetical protein|nr:PEGA domain-containing protein [bacterium]